MNIIKVAKNDPRIANLIAQISPPLEIKFHRSTTPYWGCNISNGIGHIWYQKSDNYISAFAHELLHFDAQLRGYKRIRRGISAHDQSSYFMRLMNCLDNELQHHKFYEKYLALGFTKSEFSADSAENLVTYLQEVFENDDYSFLQILPDYFTLLAPGEEIPAQHISELKNLFLHYRDGEYAEKFAQIDRILSEWRASETCDNLPTVKEILLTIFPRPNYTWFGFERDDEPPNSGFFVDQVFDIEMTSEGYVISI